MDTQELFGKTGRKKRGKSGREARKKVGHQESRSEEEDFLGGSELVPKKIQGAQQIKSKSIGRVLRGGRAKKRGVG